MRIDFLGARSRAALAAVLLLAAGGAVALAQGMPWYDRAPPRDQRCAQLEAQLAALDRTGANDARAEQIRRYEEAVNRQEADLERLVAQSRRIGCERTGFFLFGSRESPQCDPLRAQIDRARADLNRTMSALEQLRGSGNDRSEQRQAILIALAQNACGPQYQHVQRPQGFFESLFGNARPQPAYPGTPETVPGETPSGMFRTVCVRKCDGFFFPISFATTPARFAEDERACHRACPATDVELYAYRNPGEDIGQAVSISGQPYTDLPNAFRYRQEYNPACTCKRPGESWAAAIREDPTIERGDIVVTDEQAKAMSQPKTAPAARPSRAERQRRAAPAQSQPPR